MEGIWGMYAPGRVTKVLKVFYNPLRFPGAGAVSVWGWFYRVAGLGPYLFNLGSDNIFLGFEQSVWLAAALASMTEVDEVTGSSILDSLARESTISRIKQQ
ncbi:hypothetical protein TNCV_4645501 [Trichonephila clavipes]|nr:hypothetical protein TNCV_4645501 [Trichonephila clavipes]